MLLPVFDENDFVAALAVNQLIDEVAGQKDAETSGANSLLLRTSACSSTPSGLEIAA